MLIAALVLLGAGVLFQGAAFVLETLLWHRPATRRLFGVRGDEAAAATRLLAANQGVYNLVLAAIATAGILLLISDASSVIGATLAVTGGVAMTVAGVTLAVTAPRLWRAAALQAAPPLIGCALLIATLLTTG